MQVTGRSSVNPAITTAGKSGGPNDPAVQKFLFESEISQIFSMTQNFQQMLPDNVSGSGLVSQLLSQALQGPADPTDPGAHVLDPTDS